MRIVGSKYLDRNDYSNITINYGNVVVRKNREKYENIRFENNFLVKLKGLSDDDKISLLIDYYLDYHRVVGIEKRLLNGPSYIVSSSDGTELYINRVIGEALLENIYTKYESDRKNFIFSRNFGEYIPEFIVASNPFWRMKTGYVDKGESCEFYLATSEDKIVDREKEFLIDVFNPLLSDGEIAIGKEESSNLINVTFLRKSDGVCEYVDYGAPKVKVSSRVLPIIETLVISHNKEIKNKCDNKEEPKQLRMEEFK